jgi:hypothetical protein
LKRANVINFIQGAKIQISEERGRGVFASRSLKYGELIVVEKAVAEAPTEDDLIEKCTNLIRFKGIEFLRMSYMYQGEKTTGLPPLTIFTLNNYQEYRNHESIQQRFKDMDGKSCDQITS